MHGNILDVNSTNKLINQSVKDAVDDKFIESGYVTKDLLEAETSARTKGDEDLGANIKAEQTRAEGKEKEISDKLAIVDGDSNTEGSFRKAIADVIAAAPEDLDTLKEIADKLAGNDDLHTALNQAITEKADASALANEVARATGVESGLQAAIGAKQDAGSYIPYDQTVTSRYKIDKDLMIDNSEGSAVLGTLTLSVGQIYGNVGPDTSFTVNSSGIILSEGAEIQITHNGFVINDESGTSTLSVTPSGIKFAGQSRDSIPTAGGAFVGISNFVQSSEYDQKISELEARIAALEAKHPEAAA